MLQFRLSRLAQHNALATIPSTFQPRRTPGLVLPSLQNGPLPRLKPQPLHISMLIARRQQSRDRRVVQLKSWQEMQMHLKQEARFCSEQSLESAGDIACATDGTPRPSLTFAADERADLNPQAVMSMQHLRIISMSPSLPSLGCK